MFLGFIFDSVGAGEWVVLFIVILIVVGPKRLPEVARKLGRLMQMFHRAADEFKTQLMTMDQEPPKPYTPPPADADGVPKMGDGTTEDPYKNANPPEESPYPGNEDKVREWSSTQNSDLPPEPAPAVPQPAAPGAAPEPGASAAGARPAPAPQPVPPPPETPAAPENKQ
jgi:TatA/E family protein of Tat protein translocase